MLGREEKKGPKEKDLYIYLRWLNPSGLHLADNSDYVLISKKKLPGPRYFNFLRSFNIFPNVITFKELKKGITESVLSDSNLIKKLKELGLSKIHPFFSRKQEAELGELIGAPVEGPAPEYTDQLYAKSCVRGIIEKLNIPLIPGTSSSNSEIESDIRLLLSKYNKIIVKKDHESGGDGSYKIFSKKDVREVLPKISSSNVGFEIQKYLDIKCSPIMNLYIRENGIVPLGVFDQMLFEGRLTAGVVYSEHHADFMVNTNIKEKIERYSYIIAEELSRNGYLGNLNIDYVCENDCYFCELNPRIGISGIQLNLNRKIGRVIGISDPSFINLDIKINKKMGENEIFNWIGNKIITPDKSEGIYPANIGLLVKGMVNLTFFSDSIADCFHMLKMFLKQEASKKIIDYGYLRKTDLFSWRWVK